jgi:hypothetical protein
VTSPRAGLWDSAIHSYFKINDLLNARAGQASADCCSVSVFEVEKTRGGVAIGLGNTVRHQDQRDLAS